MGESEIKPANLIIKHIIGSFLPAQAVKGAIKSHKTLFGLINFSGIINSLSFAGLIHIFSLVFFISLSRFVSAR
jgi:hypothetical protein